MSMTDRTFPFTDRQIFCLFVDIATDITSLRGREISVYFYNLFSVPFCLVGEHRNEAAPTCIINGLGKMMVLYHSLDIQVLYTDGIISPNKRNGAFMQIVSTTVGDLLVKSGNFELLVFKPFAAFFLSGKMLLCFSKFTLVSSCISVICESLSIRSDKQIFQSHINTDTLISLGKRSRVSFFRKHGNEILTAWSFRDSHLPYFPFYLTMNTTFYALFELGYEKHAICDRCKLWYGEAVFGMLRFEVRKLRTLLKEIGIGYFETADSKLQGLRIDIFEPCCCFLPFQCGKRLCLCIVVVTLASKPILLFTLIEKIVIHKARTTEVLCQQFGLFPTRVQPELICLIYLSHIAYKDNNYFVTIKNFSYIFDMKENHNHKKDKE